MNDRIVIEGLCVETRIGVTEKERSRPQDVVIDVEVATDLGAAGRSDDLDETIDYDALVTEVAKLVRTSECNLLERLAANIADEVSGKSGVRGVTVRVKKQHAPVDEEVSGISVYIERGSLG
jgi:FolB domain-containing protein